MTVRELHDQLELLIKAGKGEAFVLRDDCEWGETDIEELSERVMFRQESPEDRENRIRFHGTTSQKPLAEPYFAILIH